tara:strand:- start:114 stop:785 length:672 start_codon:yes stop_codon:yes gene_type:complete
MLQRPLLLVSAKTATTTRKAIHGRDDDGFVSNKKARAFLSSSSFSRSGKRTTTPKRQQKGKMVFLVSAKKFPDSFSLLPSDSSDALFRYRKVMSVLFLLGSLLHAPDVVGIGPLSRFNAVSSFQELPVLAKLVTATWCVGGPMSAVFANKNLPIADFMVAFVASVEIIVGVDFKSGYGVEIPEPIIAAQAVNLVSAVGLRLWEKKEKEEEEERRDDDTNNNTR